MMYVIAACAGMLVGMVLAGCGLAGFLVLAEIVRGH
jgi:hypothetical protein